MQLTGPRWLRRSEISDWLQHLAIIGAVLAASAYLGPRASQRYLILLLGTGMALAFLRWPPLGLATLVFASLVVPFAIGTGTQTSLNATVLLLPVLIGLWLLDMVRRQDLRLLASRPIPPLLALCVVATLSFVAGNLTWLVFAQTAPLRAQLGGLAIFLLSAGAFLLVAHQVRDLRWLERLTWLYLGLGSVYIVGRIVPFVGKWVISIFEAGAVGTGNGLFWTWLVALAFSQAAFNRRLRLGWRLALGGLVLATFYVSLFQARDWASGWLPSVVAVVVILCVGAPRLGLSTALVVGMVAALNVQNILGMVMTDERYSLLTRLEAWRIVAEIIKANPVLGLGPANYYHYTPLYPILGWYVQFNSHNNYVDIVAQTGLLGLACFLWFAWEVGWLGWQLRHRVSTGFPRAYVYGALGGLAGTLASMMLVDTFLPFVYNIGLSGFRTSALAWLFLGGLVALAAEPGQTDRGAQR
jgi:O-antigen ligase